jgi:uncharacterized protein
MDVLAVPIICGSGDLGQISNFGFKPIQVQVFDASDETCAVMKSYLDRCSGFSNQRKRDDFRVKNIRKECKLTRIQDYESHFRAYPVETTDIDVPFSAAELRSLRRLRGKMGRSEEAVVR